MFNYYLELNHESKHSTGQAMNVVDNEVGAAHPASFTQTNSGIPSALKSDIKKVSYFSLSESFMGAAIKLPTLDHDSFHFLIWKCMHI